MLIKAFTVDNGAKSLLIDERMQVGFICGLLAQKNHTKMNHNLSLVEHIPDLYMERLLEDDDNLFENILLWRPNSNNKLLFVEREEKYDLFINPERYLLSSASSERGSKLDEKGKKSLLEEFFSPSSGSFIGLPQIEGNLYVKTDGKKVWKKHYCILRASGLYYCPKGVKSKSPKDLVCLTKFDTNTVYNGFYWKKKYKAPNDYGFAIKPPHIQNKSSKYIKYFCAENFDECKLWIQGIRIVKYGRQLKDNFETVSRDIDEEDLESLANARSFSVSEFPKNCDGSPTFGDDVSMSSNTTTGPGSTIASSSSSGSTNSSTGSGSSVDGANWNNRLSRKDSLRSLSTSSSSGFMSNASTPTMSDNCQGGIAFEADCPIGTIKRKPSLQPKIPLTLTTRNLAKQSDNALLDIESSSSGDDEKTLKNGTLRLRRSTNDERLKNIINFEGKSIGRFEPPITNSVPLETAEDADCEEEEDDCDDDDDLDDFPLPPPPETLTTSLSCLSLNSLPPPPSEFLDYSEDLEATISADVLPQSSKRKSSAKPILPVVPPKPNDFNDRLYESLTRTNANNRNSSINTVKASSDIDNSNVRISIKNSNHYQTTTLKRNSSNQHEVSSLSPSIHHQSIVTSQSQLQNNQLQPKSQLLNESTNEAIKEPIYQQIPAHIVTNQTLPSSNVIYQQPNLQHHQHLQQMQHANKLLVQQNPNICQPQNNNLYNYTESIDGPIYQEVPKHMAQHINYGNNSNNNVNNDRGSLISQRSSNGFNLLLNVNSSPNNQSTPGSRTSSIPTTPTNNNCKTSTFNKVEVAASFNYPPPMSLRSPMRGPLPPPPDIFLQDIHRVMDKKWKVAQQLSVDTSQTVSQLILGFRDPYDYYYHQQHLSPETPGQIYTPQSSNNHYEVPPNMSHHSHSRHHHHHQYNVSPCQRTDELSGCNNNLIHPPSSSSSSSSSPSRPTITTNIIMSSPNHNGTIHERDIPVPPPPPVLRCTNSTLFDKTSIRGKNAPPPPPRRSDKTRLSGRNQLKN